jgi:hypothetical protein
VCFRTTGINTQEIMHYAFTAPSSRSRLAARAALISFSFWPWSG